MLDPMTVIGQDVINIFVARIAALFFYKHTPETQVLLDSAGMRLWARMTPMLRNTFGRKVANVALELVEPSVRQAVIEVLDDPRLQPDHKGVSLKGIYHLLGFFPRMGGNVLLNLARPEHRRKKIFARGEKVVSDARQLFGQIEGQGRERLSRQITAVDVYIKQIPDVFVMLVSGVASGMAPFNLLNNLARSVEEPTGQPRPGWSDLALEITRGLPHNPTTQMDLALWETTKIIKGDGPSAQVFREKKAAALAQDYLNGSLPPAAQQAIERFILVYGGRGLAEIDMGRPRWQDDPTHIMQVFGSYMHIDPQLAPDTVFRRGAERSQQALEELVTRLRAKPHGWIKARQARIAAGRVRALLGLREFPKFMIVRLINVYRQAFLETGRQLVTSGELDSPDDLFFLSFAELAQFAAGGLPDVRTLIAARRTVYERELHRRQIPRLLLSDGRAFYEGVGASEATENSIIGSPVSPGVVEGSVHVIRDPRGAQLQPGEILVCPGTDPSWTPLFLAAGGLVMEVGGMMTHGAVVAREYGIPAVVGVHEATTRLKDGQKIRLDGSAGLITLL
jgi:pyruvate,water dikinase